MSIVACKSEGCPNPVTARGFCHRHYLNWRRANPDATDSGRRTPPAERFWSKVNKTEGCWLWAAGLDHYGYGSFYDGAKTVKAHRFAYELATGTKPDNLDHLCRNRACVNPAHLEPISRGDNVLRGVGFAAINAAKTHCKNGHDYDLIDENGWRKCSICRREQRKARDAMKAQRTG